MLAHVSNWTMLGKLHDEGVQEPLKCRNHGRTCCHFPVKHQTNQFSITASDEKMRLHPRQVASSSQTTDFLRVCIHTSPNVYHLLICWHPWPKHKTMRKGRTMKHCPSLIMGKSAAGALDYQIVEKNLEERWQLLCKKLALLNWHESFASALRQKAWRCFRHAQFRRLSPIQPLQSRSAGAASDIWDIYVSLGPLDWLTDWLTAGLAVYCHIISYCLRLLIEGLLRSRGFCEPLGARRGPTGLPQRLTPPQCQPVTATEAAKTPLVLQSLSPLAHVRHNLPAPAWPDQCQGSGFTRGAH